MSWVAGVAATMGLVVLPEVHDVYATHERLSSTAHWTYDFVLPGLRAADVRDRRCQAAGCAPRRIADATVHDARLSRRHPGRPDLDGILTPQEMLDLADRAQATGANVNRLLSEATSDGVDVHQINCTYYSALACDDERYVAARAIQLFAKGVPQIYYIGLLAGENDRGRGQAHGRRPGDQPARLLARRGP
jgi:sucrose phosphorylase